MGLYRFWAKFTGYLVVMVRGTALEKLLNLASANGIYLWDVRRHHPDVMVFHTGIRGFIALRPLLRRTRCRAVVSRRSGLPFIWQRLLRRSGLICGFIFFVAALVVATSFIWRVELVGLDKLPAATIRANLRQLGLYPGVMRGRLDKERIQQQMSVLTPQAAWIGLEIHGIMAIVRVVERVEPSFPEHRDLVAARDGLITEVVVFQGTAAVAAGDTVRAGQLLISGSEVRLDADGSMAARRVPADGRVMARVWDEERTAVPCISWQPEPTGRRVRIVRLRLGSWMLSFGPAQPSFAWYQLSRRRHALGGGRNTLPLVELIIDCFDEVRYHVKRRTPEAAAAEADREARRLLAADFPSVSTRDIQVIVQTEPGWAQAVATRERIMDITTPAGNNPEGSFDNGGSTSIQHRE